MKVVQTVSITLVIAGLVGCASMPSPLPEDGYEKIAGQWMMTYWCPANKFMDVNTAALGRQYVRASMQGFAIDQQEMDRRITLASNTSSLTTEANCIRFAVTIQERKNQIDTSNQAKQSNQIGIPLVRPTQTYCNKIGGQVLCNSF